MPTKKPEDRYEVDPADNLRREIVGSWSSEKHLRLRQYVDISRAARRKFCGNSSYIDVYCGPGRARIRGTQEVVDGSAVLAATEAMKHEAFGTIHIADLDEINVHACAARLAVRGVSGVSDYVGKAEDTAKQIVGRLSKSGLHLAFLDPYSIEAMPFQVIETLAALPRMDLVIHVSIMDLQRNVRNLIKSGRLSRFAPGWERQVSPNIRNDALLLEVFRYWRGLLSSLDYRVSDNIERVSGDKNQPLYWLVLASRNELGDRFWGEVSNVHPQMRMF